MRPLDFPQRAGAFLDGRALVLYGVLSFPERDRGFVSTRAPRVVVFVLPPPWRRVPRLDRAYARVCLREVPFGRAVGSGSFAILLPILPSFRKSLKPTGGPAVFRSDSPFAGSAVSGLSGPRTPCPLLRKTMRLVLHLPLAVCLSVAALLPSSLAQSGGSEVPPEPALTGSCGSPRFQVIDGPKSGAASVGLSNRLGAFAGDHAIGGYEGIISWRARTKPGSYSYKNRCSDGVQPTAMASALSSHRRIRFPGSTDSPQ